MKGYTKIPNNMLIESQLSIPARYLYCVLVRYTGKNEWCYPSQKTLAKDLGCSDRHIRDLIKELENQGLVLKKRKGYNRANNYKVAKSLTSDGKSGSSSDKVVTSPQLGSTFPLHQGTTTPPNSTYLIGKDNNTFNQKAFDKFRQDLIEKNLIPDKKLTIKGQRPLS